MLFLGSVPDTMPVQPVSTFSHTLRGELYWAQALSSGERLEAARGDGSGRRVLAETRSSPLLAGVCSLLADPSTQRLYWVNAHSRTMQFLDLRTLKTTTVRLQHTSDSSIYLYHCFLYLYKRVYYV